MAAARMVNARMGPEDRKALARIAASYGGNQSEAIRAAVRVLAAASSAAPVRPLAPPPASGGNG